MNFSDSEEEVDEGPQPTKEQSAEFAKGFSFFDRAETGTITSRELASVLRQIGQTPTEAEITDMINEVDADGNGTVEIDEFEEMMMNKFDDDPKNVDELRQTFDVFDTDRDGYITAQELYVVLTGLGQHLTMNHVISMIASIDKDGDGRVDFEEFAAMLNDVEHVNKEETLEENTDKVNEEGEIIEQKEDEKQDSFLEESNQMSQENEEITESPDQDKEQ